MRGVSLDQIMATTKISRRLLQALEDEQFDLLPGGIFNKSYVRAYAKCVGMDEEEAVAEYLQAAKEPTPQERAIAQQQEALEFDWRSANFRFPLLPVLILIVVAAGGVTGWKLYRDRVRQRKPPPVQAATPSPGSPSTAVATGNRQGSASGLTQQQNDTGAPKSVPVSKPNTSTAAPANAAPTAAPTMDGAVVSYTSGSSPFVVTVRPKSPAWVAIKADGKSVVRGIIKPPATKTIRASDQVVFYTGNAGEIQVAVDGKDIPVTGGANEARTLVFKAPGPQAVARVPSP